MVASLALVSLVFVAALGVGKAQDETIRRIEARAREVKKWGGWILTGVGVWFLVLATFADFFAAIFPV